MSSSEDSDAANGPSGDESIEGLSPSQAGYRKHRLLCVAFSLIPAFAFIWMFHFVIHLEVLDHAFLYFVGTLSIVVCANIAYKDLMELYKFRIAQKRDDSLNRYIADRVLTIRERRLAKKEKDDKILEHKKELIDWESCVLSAAIVNALLMASSTVLGLGLLKGATPVANYFSTALLTCLSSVVYAKSGHCLSYF